MKNIFFFAMGIIALFCSSCANDLEVEAEWKDIPVVYGLLDKSADVHYIRVEKAFLEPGGDAIKIATIADSLYYANATVQLENLTSGQTVTMERVNGTDVGFPRDPGVFAQEPNWLYKVDAAGFPLTANDSIQLVIDRGNGNELVTAGTSVQGDGRIRRPNLEITNGTPNLDFTSNTPTRIQWQAAANARIFDVTVYFNYIEYPDGEPQNFVERTVEWNWVRGKRTPRAEQSYEEEKSKEEFYAVIGSSIPVDPNMKRFFKDIDVEIVAGGRELEKFVTVQQANSGITASQETPTFTNLSEGFGVFSSITVLLGEGIDLSDATINELKNNPNTAALNF